MAFNAPMPRMMRSNNTLRTQYSPAGMTPGLQPANQPRVGGNQGNPGGSQGPGATLPPPRPGVMGAGGGSSQPVAGGPGAGGSFGFGGDSHLNFSPGADVTPGNSSGQIVDPMAHGPQAPGTVSSSYNAPSPYARGTPQAGGWGATQQQGTPDFWQQWKAANQFAKQQQSGGGGGLGRFDPRKQHPDQAFGPFGSAAGGASNPPGVGQGLAPGQPAGGAPAEQGQATPPAQPASGGPPQGAYGSSSSGLSAGGWLGGIGGFFAGGPAGAAAGAALGDKLTGGEGGGSNGPGVPTDSSSSPDYGRRPDGSIDPGVPAPWRSDLDAAMATAAPQMDPHATDELVQANDAALASRLADQREASAAEAARARMGPGYQQGLAQKAGQQGAIAQSQMDAQTRYQVGMQNFQAQLQHYQSQLELAKLSAQFAKSDDDRQFAANLQRELLSKTAEIQRQMTQFQHDVGQSMGLKDWLGVLTNAGSSAAGVAALAL